MENKYQLSRRETARAARTPNVDIYGPSATGGLDRAQDARKAAEIRQRREGLAAMSPEQRIELAQKEKQSFMQDRERGGRPSYISQSYSKTMQDRPMLSSDPAPMPGVDKRVFQLNLASWLKKKGIPEAEYYRNPAIKKQFEDDFLADLSRSALDKRNR